MKSRQRQKPAPSRKAQVHARRCPDHDLPGDQPAAPRQPLPSDLLKIADALRGTQPDMRAVLNRLADEIDTGLNGQQRPGKWGFGLLVYPFKEVGSLHYVGSGGREEFLRGLKELIARMEGRLQKEPETKQ